MSIERVERKQGWVWRVRWRDEQGAAHSRVIGRKKDAEVFQAEIVRRKRLGDLGLLIDGRQTLASFFEEWWELYALPNLAPRTLHGYRGLWERHLAPRLGDHALNAVTTEVVTRLRSEMEADGVGAPTVLRALFLLQGVFRRAVDWRRLSRNPVVSVPKPSARRQRVVRPLRPIEVEQLREAAVTRPLHGPRDATLISLLAYAGLRPQEALALHWRDIRERTILVEKAVDGEGALKSTKTGRVRTVRLLSPLARDLERFRSEQTEPADGFLVFPGSDRLPWRDSGWHAWHQAAWQPALAATGFEGVRPYDLRHSFVSLLIQEGRNIIDVARQAGHSPMMSLEVYGHVFDEFDVGQQTSAEEQIRHARSHSNLSRKPSSELEMAMPPNRMVDLCGGDR